jgi:hypothetical protein
LSTNYSDAEIYRFLATYVKSKGGEIINKANDVVAVKYPDEATPQEYTFQPALSRERKIALLTTGSPAFQQMLKECLETGVLCQVQLRPKQDFETLLKTFFKDSPFICGNCPEVVLGEEKVSLCTKHQPCYHSIKNGKIFSINVTRKEPVRYFQFYFSAAFQNKLRPKNEEIISMLIDEEGNVVKVGDSGIDNILKNAALDIQDFKTKLKLEHFDALKKVANQELGAILTEKLVLFDLPLGKEKKSKLRSFEKRLRRERREQTISRKHDFDYQKWQANYETLLKREEDSYITNIAVKFINLLVINTTRVTVEVNLGNNAVIHSSLIMGISLAPEVTCPICKKIIFEGYATHDSLYVCGACFRQSIDTAKIYSKKAALRLDETLNEWIERDSGFVCSVCGKRHSKLLEFRCSCDNSSVCIHHYGLCDVCGKVFSKLNLSYTEEFKRKLCPTHAFPHAEKFENSQLTAGVDDDRVCEMHTLQFSGVLKEIIEKYPDLDIVDFLQRKLKIPDYKAEQLAARIEKTYCQKANKKTEQSSIKTVLEKLDKPAISPKIVYPVGSLSEREFEQFMKWLLGELGYEVYPEHHSAELGVDLVAVKDGEKISIQARKVPKEYRVKNSIVSLSKKAQSTHGCTRSIVVATTHFTEQAMADAKTLGVELWDIETLSRKIAEVRKKTEVEVHSCFPPFKESLFQSLFGLEESKDFLIEPKAAEGKYDLYLPGVKFPLLTFQAINGEIVRCVYRIMNNEPVGELEGTALIKTDRSNNKFGPDDPRAYVLIIQYLEQFLK